MRPARIAILEDDAAIAEVLGLQLRRAGFEVRAYADGPSALRDLPEFWPDLMVLDLGLPGPDGLSVLQRLRQEGDLPVLVLTARGTIRDKVRGFGLGADDYVVKPFDSDEVLARIRALLRRAGRLLAESVTVAELHVDRGACAVRLAGRSVPLSPREVDLLFALAQSPNRALTRGQLLDRVWGDEAEVDARVVDAYVKRVRRKLLDAWDGPDPLGWRIETLWGVGYKFAVDTNVP